MADTFDEQLDEDRDNAFLATSEFAELVTYLAVATQTTTNNVPCAFEELSGGHENFHDQSPASRAGIARISDDAIAAPVAGDQITRGGSVWTVVKVTSDGLGMHELRVLLPETVA